MKEFLLKDWYVKSKDLLSPIQSAGWRFTNQMWENLNKSEKEWIHLEFSPAGPEYYKERIKMIGFIDMDNVIDAACGYARWTLPLADMNKNVFGIDIHPSRLSVAQELLANHDKTNVILNTGNLEKLPYEDNFADGIFCYSVIMYTNIAKTLDEFYRVLKPGGKLYLNYNHYGWYLHLLLDRVLRKWDIKLLAGCLIMLLNALTFRKSNRIITNRFIDKQLQKSGFTLLNRASEGQINITALNGDLPVLIKEKFYGLPSVVEIIAVKKNI